MDSVSAAINKISSEYKVDPSDPMFAVLKAVADIVRSPGERELIEAQARTKELASTLTEATTKLSAAVDSMGQQITAVEIFRFRRMATFVVFGLFIGVVVTTIASALLYRWTAVYDIRDAGIKLESTHPTPGRTIVRLSSHALKNARRDGENVYLEFGK